MVGLVIEHHDVFQPHEIGHHTLDHLALGLDGHWALAGAAFEERTATGGHLNALAELEGVVVRDHELRLLQVLEHVHRDDLAVGIVVVRIVRLEDAQAVSNG